MVDYEHQEVRKMSEKTGLPISDDELEQVSGGATFDFFDQESKDSVGLSKPCPHCGKEFYVTLGKTVCDDCRKKGYS